MNKLGQLNCTTNSKNTGFGSCFEDFKQIVGAFIYDSPRTFSDAEIAALLDTLNADAANDVKSKRVFPVHNFVAVTDNSEKVILETFDYGGKAIVRDGDIDWTFQYVDGGNCLQQALRSHNGKRYALFYDKENKLLGYNKKDTVTGAPRLSAIPLQFFYAHPWGAASGSKTAAYMVEFVLLAKYINDERAFVKADFDLSEIAGLQDIDIIVNTWNQNTGVANVSLEAACGANNIYDMFSADIVDTLFSASDQDGNAIAVESIQPVPASKTFDVTLTAAQLPDSGTVTFTGGAVSALVAKEIVGYEIGSVDLEVSGS